jgi:hypothetical protein
MPKKVRLRNGVVVTLGLGDTQNILKYLELMRSEGITPTDLVYQFVMRAFVKTDPKQALQYFSKMEQEGIKPSANTYSVALQAAKYAKDTEIAQQIVTKMGDHRILCSFL